MLSSTPEGKTELTELLKVMECDSIEEAIAQVKADIALSLEAADAIKKAAGMPENAWPSARERAFFIALCEQRSLPSERGENTAAEVKAALDEASTRLGAYAAPQVDGLARRWPDHPDRPAVAAPEPVAALREKMLCRALQQALKLLSNRCRQVLYEEHGEILRWLQGYK